jgi:hypothetical protein
MVAQKLELEKKKRKQSFTTDKYVKVKHYQPCWVFSNHLKRNVNFDDKFFF